VPRAAEAELRDAELLYGAVQPVNEQFDRTVLGRQLPQVGDGVVQLGVGVVLALAVMARPAAALQLDRPKEPRHRASLIAGPPP
jgi:hypothetical protein